MFQKGDYVRLSASGRERFRLVGHILKQIGVVYGTQVGFITVKFPEEGAPRCIAAEDLEVAGTEPVVLAHRFCVRDGGLSADEKGGLALYSDYEAMRDEKDRVTDKLLNVMGGRNALEQERNDLEKRLKDALDQGEEGARYWKERYELVRASLEEALKERDDARKHRDRWKEQAEYLEKDAISEGQKAAEWRRLYDKSLAERDTLRDQANRLSKELTEAQKDRDVWANGSANWCARATKAEDECKMLKEAYKKGDGTDWRKKYEELRSRIAGALDDEDDPAPDKRNLL